MSYTKGLLPANINIAETLTNLLVKLKTFPNRHRPREPNPIIRDKQFTTNLQKSFSTNTIHVKIFKISNV